MSKNITKLSASLRKVFGRQVNSLRRDGFTPATIYGHEFTPISVQFNTKELKKTFDHAGESSLVEVVIDSDSYPILFKNPQYHPLSGDLLHIDCHKVNLKEKIVATVPLEFTGESLAVKNGNVLVTILDEIEVEALPTDLPENIIVDITGLTDVEQMITVSELNIDRSKVEIKTDPTQTVVKIEAPKIEEEPVVAPEAEVAPGDVPATEQKGDTEGETTEGAEEKGEKPQKDQE